MTKIAKNSAYLKLISFFRSLGPGLLFAGAAIGVSHLVQSTRAGATFGFGLLWAVLLANFIKYPFYEYGTRYTLATGESILKGYQRLGNWVLVTFLVFSLMTAFTIQAAVTAVTAGIAQYLLPIGTSISWWSSIILFCCMIFLTYGHYKTLDKLIKYIIVLLSIATFAALGAAIGIRSDAHLVEMPVFDWNNAAHITLLIGLMGWMPSNLDMSVWQSIWTMEKMRIQPDFDYRKGIRDFNVGYAGVIVVAIAFLSLGALAMHGSGETFAMSSSAFAGQLISLYTKNLGAWATWIISIAALSAMFSTTITCFDAIARMYTQITKLLRDRDWTEKQEKNRYGMYLMILLLISVVIIAFFSGQMIALVTLATILSFLTAPVFAAINYKLVRSAHMPEKYKPGGGMRAMSYFGFMVLLAFSGYYLFFLVSS